MLARGEAQGRGDLGDLRRRQVREAHAWGGGQGRGQGREGRGECRLNTRFNESVDKGTGLDGSMERGEDL